MMSRRECLSKAHDCERKARDSLDDMDRRMLLTTAEQWRSLAKEAKAAVKRDDGPE